MAKAALGMKKAPKEITMATLQVIVMPNGEVICGGKSLGFVPFLGPYLTPAAKESK